MHTAHLVEKIQNVLQIEGKVDFFPHSNPKSYNLIVSQSATVFYTFLDLKEICNASTSRPVIWFEAPAKLQERPHSVINDVYRRCGIADLRLAWYLTLQNNVDHSSL